MIKTEETTTVIWWVVVWLRRSKTTGGVTTDFVWVGGLLMAQQSPGQTIAWSYDQGGKMVGFELKTNNTSIDYFYLRNLQGDIIGIYDSAGTVVVNYAYDAWGNLEAITGPLAGTLGKDNPIRYRGYYWDWETQMYYLQSRYYSPELHRFVSADVLVDTQQGIMGTNMYAYCLNDPVNYYDPTGMWNYVIHEGSEKEGTLYWAILAGLTPDHAKIVARANQAVDDFKTNAAFNQRPHFAAHGAWGFYEEHYDIAVGLWETDREASLNALGTALHALQDYYAHLDWTVGVDDKNGLANGSFRVKHAAKSADTLKWTKQSVIAFEAKTFNVWRDETDGFFYYREMDSKWQNPRYVLTRIATIHAIISFTWDVGYGNLSALRR